jgi:hypothetical protein
MRIIRTTGAALLIAVCAHEAQSQGRLALDLRAAVATPTGKVAGADLGTAIGFGGTVALQLSGAIHAYGGWDWMPFSADESFAGNSLTFVETGYTFGLRLERFVRAAGRTALRLEGGGTYKSVAIENDAGNTLVDSDLKLGFELGAGLVMPLGDVLRVTPTVRFRSLSPEFGSGSVTTEGTLRYLGLELGFSFLF